MTMQETNGADSRTWRIEAGNGDPLYSVLPLRGNVSKALSAQLIRDGNCKCCGECNKPFSSARKRRGIARVNHVDISCGLFISTAWLLCGRCHGEMKRNGNRVSNKLIGEARSAVASAQLLQTPHAGSA